MSEDLRIRLLIVDDEQSIRRLCMTVGSSLEYLCSEAESAEAALAQSPAIAPDIVIADLLRGLQDAQDDAYQEHERGRGEGGEGAPPRVLLIVEEAHEFLSEERVEKMRTLFEQVARIAKRGRKRWLGLVFVTQLPGHLPRQLFGLVNSYILHKITDPAVVSLLRKTVSGIDEGLWARLIAGQAFGARSRVHTHSPMFYVHWRLEAGARAQLPAEYSQRAAYVVAGSVEVGGQRFGPGKMPVFTAGQAVTFPAVEAAILMLLGGEPVGERFIEWNFVSSSRERIEQAKADWRAGRMKLPDLDHDEFIPLPPDPPPPPASPL